MQAWETDAEGNETGTRKIMTDTGEEENELVARTETIRFVYLNAGYITIGVGTVLTFRDGKMTVKRYALAEGERAEPLTLDLAFPAGK